MSEIEKLRKELATLINDKVKPMRAKLDNLLNEEAKKLCPFSEDEIITLDNGKKGKITKVEYLSLDYHFQLNENDFYGEHFDGKLGIDDVFAYNVDDKSFSITWRISGLRMKENGTVVGKQIFYDISPKDYIINSDNKSVKRKQLPDFIDNLDFLTNFKGFSEDS